MTSLEAAPSSVDNYGLRIRGYLCIPQTGGYTFYVAGHNTAEVWLSTDDNPANKMKIAYQYDWAEFRNWNKYPSQKSAAITLQAGRRYYIEVLYKQGTGGDYITVAWTLPNGVTQIPIPGSSLSPYTGLLSNNMSSGIQLQQQPLGSDLSGKIELKTYPNPFTSLTTIQVTSPESGTARVEVRDLQGRLVRNLFNGTIEAGSRKVFTLQAEGLTEGIYLIKFITRTKVITQKVILAK